MSPSPSLEDGSENADLPWLEEGQKSHWGRLLLHTWKDRP